MTTTTTPVNVTVVPVRGDLDLYCRYPGQNDWQRAYIEIDPSSRTLSADYNGNVGNAVPMEVWHHRLLRVSLARPLPAADANALMEQVAPLAATVCDGWSEHWDGHNFVGVLDEDAQAALDQIEQACDEPRYTTYEVWTADDWLSPCSNGELDLSAATTDDDIAALAETLDREAHAQNVLVYDGETALAQVLERRRDRLVEAED
jgi:hypothetical protein